MDGLLVCMKGIMDILLCVGVFGRGCLFWFGCFFSSFLGGFGYFGSIFGVWCCAFSVFSNFWSWLVSVGVGVFFAIFCLAKCFFLCIFAACCSFDDGGCH